MTPLPRARVFAIVPCWRRPIVASRLSLDAKRDGIFVSTNDVVSQSAPSELTAPSSDEIIQIGILTRGKPTLGMVLVSLLLQEAVSVRVLILDTSVRPVVNRDDVRFALRLASDRGIPCSYDFVGPSDRAFSAGKTRLVRALAGPFLCLADDDVVMPSNALARMCATAGNAGVFGYVTPHCKNAPQITGHWGARPPCTPGSLIYQDDLVHRTLLEYYDNTVDVLDRRKSANKVWEIAVLTSLFDVIDRPAIRQDDVVTYHLDYHEGPQWIDDERKVIGRSAKVAREVVRRVDVAGPQPAEQGPIAMPGSPAAAGLAWMGRTLRALHLLR